MKLPLILPLFALSASFLAPLSAAQEEKPAPLPADIVARLGSEEIGLQEYQDYLYQRMGKRPLHQLIDSKLVQQEARRYDIQIEESAVQAAVEERLQQARQGRPEEEFLRNLRQGGLNLELFTHNLHDDVVQELTLNALVRATRVPTDTLLQQAFESKYGPGGSKVEVRHILIMPNFLRAEKIKAGANPKDLDLQALKAEARQRAEECLQRLNAGEDMAALVAKYSHDQVSLKNQGILPSYRPGLYGTAFTEAVKTLAPGAYSQVLESGAGFHIVQVVSRVVTQFEDVRATLVEEVMRAEPTWQEREQFLRGLREAADIQLW